MRYDRPKDDRDGQGLARRLADMQRQISASSRLNVGQRPDTTPPPADVEPGSITGKQVER